jgi:hypothetical protein
VNPQSQLGSAEIHNVNIAGDQGADEQQPNDEQREFHFNSYSN